MLQSRHAGRDENAEMAHMRVGEIDDTLSGGLEGLCVLVDGRNPAQCLVWWCDVVTVRGEDDERIANTGQIGDATLVDLHLSLFKLVSDEEVVDDGDHFLATQPIEAIPPPLEVQESLLLGVDVGEEIRVLVPNGRLWL